MAIDSHTHINSLVIPNPQNEILRINNDLKLEQVINIGLDIPTSKESLTISKQNPKFYSSVGIHPLYTESQSLEELIKIAKHDKVVAIGEIGLDSTKPNYSEQLEYFINQIIIANELQLPVIIHANNTNQEIIRIFESIIRPKYGCVFHCFQPDFSSLKYLVENGYYISFAGRITYKTANKSLKIASLVPEELFLVETDAPYISPEPFRNEVNSSTNLSLIIEKIAEVRKTTPESIDKITSENTKRLFKKIL